MKNKYTILICLLFTFLCLNGCFQEPKKITSFYKLHNDNVETAYKEITWEKIKNANTEPENIDSDLTLVKPSNTDVSIVWSSSDKTVVAVTEKPDTNGAIIQVGQVYRSTTGAIAVTLTATVSQGEIIRNKEFKLVVKKLN